MFNNLLKIDTICDEENDRQQSTKTILKNDFQENGINTNQNLTINPTIINNKEINNELSNKCQFNNDQSTNDTIISNKNNNYNNGINHDECFVSISDEYNQNNVENYKPIMIQNDCENNLPDVACVSTSQGHYNILHSYGSNQDNENQPLLKRFDNESIQIINNYFPEDIEYNNLIRDVEQAIENGILPKRISQGSSGSYFVKNVDGTVCIDANIIRFINKNYFLENYWCL